MAKPEKPAAAASAATGSTEKANSKKKLLLIGIGTLLLAAGGGAGWYFTKGSHHAEEARPVLPAKFFPLEPFTVNLQHDNGDQFLQIGITLKFFEPALEEKIKLHNPEIRSRLLLLLASKHAADLSSPEGKKKLMREILAETSAVLGLQALPVPRVVYTPPSPAPASEVNATSSETAASETTEAASAAAPTPAATPAPAPVQYEYGPPPLEVLFTSFIIQ